jgi:hypothetical protein
VPLHGHKSYFAVDDSAGTLRNISACVTSVTFEQDNDTHDSTCFGAEGHTFVVGLTNGKITVVGLWDKSALVGSDTVFNGLAGLEGTTTSVEYGPEGNTTGQKKKTCETVLESYVESDPVADLVTFTATLQISGSVTTTVF